VFDTFSTFAQDVRKDCMFISDPLRYIFVNGPDSKVISLRDKNFSQHIYGPLKNSYGNINTNFSATYGNWVKVYDGFTDTFVWVPASGYAASIFARTDATTQPWIAPAGLNRGMVNNIIDLAFNPNQKQRDFLYTISINPIVTFSGDGFAIFGQKTLQNKPSAFDRINVRRLFLSLERATQQALRYFVFEPNTEFTRTRLKNTITPIFELAKNTEGLYEYLIVCDDRNNTSDVVDRNELAVDIYIKPDQPFGVLLYTQTERSIFLDSA
jgi:phage tail sheath protein FI